jgi:hypothetical protein
LSAIVARAAAMESQANRVSEVLCMG